MNIFSGLLPLTLIFLVFTLGGSCTDTCNKLCEGYRCGSGGYSTFLELEKVDDGDSSGIKFQAPAPISKKDTRPDIFVVFFKNEQNESKMKVHSGLMKDLVVATTFIKKDSPSMDGVKSVMYEVKTEGDCTYSPPAGFTNEDLKEEVFIYKVGY
jgi:hypothetical protein